MQNYNSAYTLLKVMLKSVKLLRLLILIFLLSFALAQEGQSTSQAQESSEITNSQDSITTPEADMISAGIVADQAIADWLKKESPNFMTMASKSPEEVCAELPALVQSPPPPKGTTVNIADRRVVESTETDIAKFTYPASLAGRNPQIIEVSLDKTEQGWQAKQVSVKIDLPNSGFRDWLQSRLASWLFIAFSVFVFYSLAVPSFLRKWLLAAWNNIKEHKRIVIATVGFLASIFTVGVLTGMALPEACKESVHTVLLHLVGSVGATEAYGSGNIARAATITFYQNFGSVTLMVLYGSALLFGFPAYLISTLSFYIQGVPFGLLGGGNPIDMLITMIVIVLELSAYFLVVAGGGIFLATLIKKGFKGFSEGLNKLTLMLPVALVLLLIGAWFEAFMIIVRG